MSQTETKPTRLCQKAKEIVLNVAQYFENEYNNPSGTSNKAYTCKTSEATKINARTIRKIKEKHYYNEILGDTSEKSAKKSVTKPSEAQNKLEIDDFDCGVIRRKINEFYTVRKQLPTL